MTTTWEESDKVKTYPDMRYKNTREIKINKFVDATVQTTEEEEEARMMITDARY